MLHGLWTGSSSHHLGTLGLKQPNVLFNSTSRIFKQDTLPEAQCPSWSHCEVVIHQLTESSPNMITYLKALPTGLRVMVANRSRRHRHWRSRSRCPTGFIVPLKETTAFILAFCTNPKETPFIGTLLCDRTLNCVLFTPTLTC